MTGSNLIIPPAPVLALPDFEASLHQLGAAFVRDLRPVVPHCRLLTDGSRAHFAVATVQRTDSDLVDWGSESQRVKDECLDRFMRFFQSLRMAVHADPLLSNIAVHAVDPITGACVGLPDGVAGSTYSEVDGGSSLLKYRIVETSSCCKIMLHPRWKSFCYPATIFLLDVDASLSDAVVTVVRTFF